MILVASRVQLRLGALCLCFQIASFQFAVVRFAGVRFRCWPNSILWRARVCERVRCASRVLKVDWPLGWLASGGSSSSQLGAGERTKLPAANEQAACVRSTAQGLHGAIAVGQPRAVGEREHRKARNLRFLPCKRRVCVGQAFGRLA